MDGAYKDLLEDLALFIIIELNKRISNTINLLDEEQHKKLKDKNQEYWVEKDGY